MLPGSRLNKGKSPWQNFKIKYLPLILCILTGVGYCSDALRAPFFGGAESDLLSNLLPVVHYRYSILHDGVLPLHTDLWYGGRAQWQNPLWSFFYLPVHACLVGRWLESWNEYSGMPTCDIYFAGRLVPGQSVL